MPNRRLTIPHFRGLVKQCQVRRATDLLGIVIPQVGHRFQIAESQSQLFALLSLRTQIRHQAECFRCMTCKRVRDLERSSTLDRSLPCTPFSPPIDDIQHAAAGHCLAFHKMLYRVESLRATRMAETRFGKPADIDVSPKKAGDLRKDV